LLRAVGAVATLPHMKPPEHKPPKGGDLELRHFLVEAFERQMVHFRVLIQEQAKAMSQISDALTALTISVDAAIARVTADLGNSAANIALIADLRAKLDALDAAIQPPEVLPGVLVTTLTAPVVVATAGEQTVDLSWAVVPSATGYRVMRATIPGGPYRTVATPTALAFQDTGLVEGATMYYVVHATTSAGYGANSVEVKAVVL